MGRREHRFICMFSELYRVSASVVSVNLHTPPLLRTKIHVNKHSTFVLYRDGYSRDAEMYIVDRA